MHNAKRFFLVSSLVCLPLLTLPLTRGQEKEPVKYIGPGSCAATSCHGSIKPIAGSRILQNEYSTWILQDKHSRAYQALTGEVGERSEEHTSELHHTVISYAVFCLKKKKITDEQPQRFICDRLSNGSVGYS